jgi:hypothetical protein
MEFPNIDESINLYNNSPQEKLSGLSPFQTYEIIHNPLGEKSPIKYRNNIDDKVLDKIPFFRIAEEFLKIIERDKLIKLTYFSEHKNYIDMNTNKVKSTKLLNEVFFME